MDTATIIAVISVAATLSGMVLGWLGRSRTVRQDTFQDAGREAKLQTDMEYIKRGVDDTRIEVKTQGKKFDEFSERLTRAEESVKQAHKRLDRIEAHN